MTRKWISPRTMRKMRAEQRGRGQVMRASVRKGPKPERSITAMSIEDAVAYAYSRDEISDLNELWVEEKQNDEGRPEVIEAIELRIAELEY